MTINVTPIPKLTTLTTPAFTLGTTNAAGDALTAVASNSTLLAFDTTIPAVTSTASTTGSATTAARRDHVHATMGTLTTVIRTSRTAAAGAGAQAITGSGFAPTGVVVFAARTSTAIASWGMGDDANAEAANLMLSNGDMDNNGANFIYCEGWSDDMFALLTSLDADGCTLTWTKNGSGGDIYFSLLFIR